MAARETRHWNYPEVDAAVICLWPLVKRYHWTYRDLLNVMLEGDPQLRRYPCQRVEDLATYCANVLGLRKTAQGKTSKKGRPQGCEVARRLFPRRG